jgi:hypothetical protein
MRALHFIVAVLLLVSAGAAVAQDPPETTEDGLVRVPSNSRAGV